MLKLKLLFYIQYVRWKLLLIEINDEDVDNLKVNAPRHSNNNLHVLWLLRAIRLCFPVQRNI